MDRQTHRQTDGTISCAKGRGLMKPSIMWPGNKEAYCSYGAVPSFLIAHTMTITLAYVPLPHAALF